MSVFVTGGTGLIGTRVVRGLTAHGHNVRCLYRSENRLARLDGLPVEPVHGNLLNPASLETAVRGCTTCVHLAAVSGWSAMPGARLRATIVEGTRNLMAALSSRGVGRLVHVSSAATLTGTRRPVARDETAGFDHAGAGLTYAEAKAETEQLVREMAAEAGIQAVIVNPVETYADYDWDWVTAGSVRDILTSWPGLAVPGGTAVAHADDVADGIVAALARGRPGERYILGGENLTYAQLVRLVLRLAGTRRPVATVPFAALRAAVTAAPALRLRPPVDPALVDYLRFYWFVDGRKAETELGYRPRPAEAALAPTVAWVQTRLADGRRDRAAAGAPVPREAGGGRIETRTGAAE